MVKRCSLASLEKEARFRFCLNVVFWDVWIDSEVFLFDLTVELKSLALILGI